MLSSLLSSISEINKGKLRIAPLELVNKYKFVFRSFREYKFYSYRESRFTNTIPEKKAERDTIIMDINTIPGYIHYINFLIILVGTTSSLTPML